MNHDNIHSLRTSVQPLLSFAEEVIPGCQLAIDLATSDGGAIRLCEPTSSLPAPPNTTTSPILHGDETIGWLIGTAPAILQNHLPALAGLAAQALTSDLNTRNSLARRSLSRILATTSLPEIPTDFASAKDHLASFLTILAQMTDSRTASLEVLPDCPLKLVDLIAMPRVDRNHATQHERVAIDGVAIAELHLSPNPKHPIIVGQYDHKLLRHAAFNLGTLLGLGLKTLEMLEKSQQFSSLLVGFSDLYTMADTLLDSRRDVDDILDAFFDESLRVADASVPNASILDIRWVTQRPEGRALHFRRVRGSAWDQAPTSARERKFSLDSDRHASKGSSVFWDGHPQLILDVNHDPDYSPTFSSVQSMIITPISVESKRQGVLDLRSTEGTLSHLDKEIAEAVGKQVGLIAHLFVSMRSVEQGRSDLERLQLEQLQATEDLGHQLIGPVSQLERRTVSLLERHTFEPSIRSKLYKIRGLARRSLHVTKALRYYVELAKGHPLIVEPVVHTADDLTRILNAATRNAEVVSQQAVRMYSPDVAAVREVLADTVYLDPELVEQAVASLLDNAGKYGYPKSSVDVFIDRPKGSGEVVIGVVSLGQSIRPGDTERCKQRGWRAATQYDLEVAAEGKGIGLWIVDCIMHAHGGRLTIDVRGDTTTVRLRFPPTIRSELHG